MKEIVYTGSDEDIQEIMNSLNKDNSRVRKEESFIVIFTKEESRLVRLGQSVVICNGKLM